MQWHKSVQVENQSRGHSIPALSSGSAALKSRPRDQLSWLMFAENFLSPFRQMHGNTLN
jgi:hypothetical protein